MALFEVPAQHTVMAIPLPSDYELLQDEQETAHEHAFEAVALSMTHLIDVRLSIARSLLAFKRKQSLGKATAQRAL